MANKIDPYEIIGKKFNYLKVMAYGHYVKPHHFYICRCECEQLTLVRRDSLLTGNTKSCGCMKPKSARLTGQPVSHGQTVNRGKTRTYRLWNNAKTRCYCKSHDSYKNYGRRGIKMCDEWKNSFQTFYNYVMKNLGECPEGYWMDRIDVNGDYEPGNIRYVTPKQSAQNKRN